MEGKDKTEEDNRKIGLEREREGKRNVSDGRRDKSDKGMIAGKGKYRNWRDKVINRKWKVSQNATNPC